MIIRNPSSDSTLAIDSIQVRHTGEYHPTFYGGTDKTGEAIVQVMQKDGSYDFSQAENVGQRSIRPGKVEAVLYHGPTAPKALCLTPKEFVIAGKPRKIRLRISEIVETNDNSKN